MARIIREPRTQIPILVDADLVGLWRCEGVLATDNFNDEGADGLTLTQVNGPTVSTDIIDSSAGGSRQFNGTTQYAWLASNAYIAAVRASWSWGAWITPDTLHAATLFAYGGTGAGGGVNNVIAEVGITAGGFFSVTWQNGVNVDNTYVTTIPYEDRVANFVGVSVGPDAGDPTTLRLHVYGFNARTRAWSAQVIDNVDGNTLTTSARFSLAVDGSLAAGFYDGKMTDAVFARVPLHEWWFREQARHGPQSTYSQAGMLNSSVTAPSYRSVARCRVQLPNLSWHDLDALGPTEERMVKSIEWSRRRDDPRSTAKINLFRAAGNFNLAIEDRASQWNLSGGSYVPLLQGRRRARVEFAMVPDHDREIEEWEWEGLFEGFIDDPTAGGEEFTLTLLDISTPLADMQIIDAAKYGNVAGTTVFDTTLQDIVDDNKPASYAYLGGLTPDLWFPSATALTHNVFWAQGMSVLEKLSELVEAVGFDCRATYDDVRHEERVAVYEPDRTTASVQWTWGINDYFSIGDWRQTTSDVRNWCRVYYGNAAARDATTEPTRSFQEYLDTTSISKFGPLYCELNEGTGSLVDAAAEALALATLVVQELSDPIAWFSAHRPFHPFVELADRVRFSADGSPVMLFSQNTDIACIGVRHVFDTNGARTSVECQGLRASSRGHRLNGRFPSHGAPSAPVRTPEAPTGLAWANGIGGGVLSWQYPAGRVGRIADLHEIHIGNGVGFTVDTTDPSTTLVGVVRGTVFPIGGYLDADTMPTHAKIIARDRFNNMSAASTGLAITAYYAAIVPSFRASRDDATPTNLIGTTPAKVLCDVEEFDTGGDYDNATNYRFTAPRPGTYSFTGQMETTVAAVAIRAYLYVNGALEISGTVVDDMSVGFDEQPIATVAGDIYLDAGDYCELWGYIDDGAAGTRAVQFRTHFSGHLVSEWQ